MDGERVDGDVEEALDFGRVTQHKTTSSVPAACSILARGFASKAGALRPVCPALHTDNEGFRGKGWKKPKPCPSKSHKQLQEKVVYRAGWESLSQSAE